MKTPSWLLNIVYSCLEQRTITLSYQGATSSQKALPAGIPQGAYMGGLIFIIKFNEALLRPDIPRPSILSNARSVKVKYIDDGTVAVSVDLKTYLVPDPVARPRPVQYEERTGHSLPAENNLLQSYIHEAENYTNQNNMKINKSKSNVLKFTFARKLDFPTNLTFSDGSPVGVLSETTLLGVIISNDLKWQKNTSFICAKARKKLWVLRRMANLDLSRHEMLDVYGKEVRSILEYAVPVWHPGITRKQSSEIESIQKIAFKILLGPAYRGYSNACAVLGAETLEKRRQSICLKFAAKNLKSENCLFNIARTSQHNLRQKKQSSGRV